MPATPLAIQAAWIAASCPAQLRDIAGQRDRVPAGIHRDVTLIRDQRPAAQRALGGKGDAGRPGVVAGLEFTCDGAHTGQHGNGCPGGGQHHGAGYRRPGRAGAGMFQLCAAPGLSCGR